MAGSHERLLDVEVLPGTTRAGGGRGRRGSLDDDLVVRQKSVTGRDVWRRGIFVRPGSGFWARSVLRVPLLRLGDGRSGLRGRVRGFRFRRLGGLPKTRSRSWDLPESQRLLWTDSWRLGSRAHGLRHPHRGLLDLL